jgi:translocation and assembly module TamB
MKTWQIITTSVVLIVAGSVTWLVTTESGLRWSFEQVTHLIPGQVQSSKISGKLIGPLSIQNIRFEQNGTLVNIEKVYLEWRPARLLKGVLDIALLDINHIELTQATKEPDNEPISLPDIQLPMAIRIEHLRLTDLDINQPGQHLIVNSVALSAKGENDAIHIDQLLVKAPQYQFDVTGNLKTTSTYEHQLSINWETSQLPDKTLKGNGTLNGSLENTQLNHRITQPVNVYLTANIENILAELSWQAEVKADDLVVRELNPEWPDASTTIALQGSGDLNTADIEGIIKGRYENIKDLSANLSITREENNRIDLKQLKLTQADTQGVINTRGYWQPDENGGHFDLSLDWNQLQWPLAINKTNCKSDPDCSEAKSLIVNASQGRGQIAGKPDQYQITLQSNSDLAQIGQADIRLDADGNLEGLKLNSLNIATPSGLFLTQGNLAWAPEINWTATVSAKDINPEKIDPQWPGQLQVKLNTSGEVKSGKLNAIVKDINATGKLRGYPVNLTGQLKWQNDQAYIEQVNLQSENSTLKLNGVIGKQYNLTFALQSPNLSELYPEARGKLNTKGLLTGTTESPVIKTELQGSQLSFLDYKIEKINGHLAADVFKWKQLDIDITATNLKLNDRIIQTAMVNVDKRHFKAQAIADDLQLKVAMNGGITTTGWSGEVQQASLVITNVAQWQLDKPSKITLSAKSVNTDPLCWHDNGSGKACITLKQLNTGWQSELDVKQLSVALFKQWLPELMIVEGLANIKSTLIYQKPDGVLGNVDIGISKGKVAYPLVEGGREEWDYKQAIIKLSLKPEGISTEATVDIGESERVKANVYLPNAKLLDLDPTRQPIRANASINIQDIGLIAALIPDIANLEGNIKVDIDIDGTLNKPTIAGELALQKGRVDIPKLGLNITGIQLQGNTTAMQQFNYQLDAKSGDGTITATGSTQLNRSNGWPTTLSISGKSFQVAKIPEAQIVIDPDLQVSLQSKTIKVEGTVVIPYAKLQPKDISLAARVSDDVVIVGNELEEMEKWRLTSRVRVILGDRVSFYGYGFEGRLGGNLLLEDKPGQITKATGEINVPEGRYRAYGQRLDIEHGRMLFSGGPPMNPGLDLRAVRKIGTVTAGIKVRGSLKNPQLDLFSVPSMGQTDTLSYLLLGRPLETANTEDGNIMARAALAMGLSGGDRIARSLGDRFGIDEMHVDSSDDGSQASLVLGKYLSPKLYVSYGVGLIEAVNTINLRYQISDKWQLTGESGQYQGADILYTIER